MATQDALTVGGVVADTYRITRLLGRGGMGAVWAAEHLRLPGRQVAVKVLLSPGVATGEAFARFRREAEIASRLGHPNIVQVLDFHTLSTGEPYIILELLEGETLAQRLQRGPLPLEETLAVARQVGSALQAAHRAGVVHRDLKPDNVFLCTPQEEMPGPQVKVLDFGISKIRGSQTVATQDAVLLGTPQYMAPEQALGRNTAIDPRTDVFALGAIVYEMLGGVPAFAGSSLAEVVYKVVHAQPQPLAQLRPGLPLNILSAVDRALQKDPMHRPLDVSAFVAELTGRPLTNPVTASRAPAMDATLASPAQPIPLSKAETDATFSPLTPVPAARMTAPFSQPPPARPWATPTPATPPASAWPAPFSNVPTPKAELIGVKPDPLVSPKQSKARIPRWALVPLFLFAMWAVFKKSTGTRDIAGAVRAAQAIAQGASPTQGVPPATQEDAEMVKREITQGIEQVKQGIRAALRDKANASDQAQAEQARAQAEEGPPAPPAPPDEQPDVKELLSDASEALDDEDPKNALRLADQSFFTKKTSEGWAIKARANCQLKDLGNARASFNNVKGKAARAAVISDCKKHGIDLR